MASGRDVVHYFAYGADLDAATWGFPTEAATLRYHRLVFARGAATSAAQWTVIPSPSDAVPGLVFRVDYADLARIVGLLSPGDDQALDSLVVATADHRVLFARAHRTCVPVAMEVPRREEVARLRTLYNTRRVSTRALDAAVSHAIVWEAAAP